jgi:hypothetical protein
MGVNQLFWNEMGKLLVTSENSITTYATCASYFSINLLIAPRIFGLSSLITLAMAYNGYE